MVRREDWASRLYQYIADVQDEPFAWGAHDCLLFVADCVMAMTGVDYAERFRGRYKTEIGAYRLLKKLGGMESVLDAYLGVRVNIKMAKRGDVVLLDVGHGLTGAICLGATAVSVGPDRMRHVPMRHAVSAWSV